MIADLALADAVYEVDGDRITTRSHAAGPWDPTMQHGSAPAGLVTWAAEGISTAAPMVVSRITIDLPHPVPVGPLTLRRRVIREGRNIQLCEVILSTNDKDVVRASVLKVLWQPDLVPGGLGASMPNAPDPCGAATPTKLAGMGSPFLNGISMRLARGGFDQPGPAAVWYRADRPIVQGEAMSPAVRAALTADFCNGTGAVLEAKSWVFPNGDLTLNLIRPPRGDWILVEAETWIGPDGAGLASARLADFHGYFARATQTLVIARR